jgi:predicted tellurium resistance membrane protein TerC
MLELLTQAETWISLATLSAMEIVLGIDNIVFLSILSGKLPRRAGWGSRSPSRRASPSSSPSPG